MDDKLVWGEMVRNKFLAQWFRLTLLTASGIWEKAACWAIWCCIAMRVDSLIWGCWICAVASRWDDVNGKLGLGGARTIVIYIGPIIANGHGKVNFLLQILLCIPKWKALLRHVRPVLVCCVKMKWRFKEEIWRCCDTIKKGNYLENACISTPEYCRSDFVPNTLNSLWMSYETTQMFQSQIVSPYCWPFSSVA